MVLMSMMIDCAVIAMPSAVQQQLKRDTGEPRWGFNGDLRQRGQGAASVVPARLGRASTQGFGGACQTMRAVLDRTRTRTQERITAICTILRHNYTARKTDESRASGGDGCNDRGAGGRVGAVANLRAAL